jgi:uridylate kinase
VTPDSPGQDNGILVRKYGGSSLASAARIRTVARDLRAARDRGFRLVVVVSAMGKTTDELAALAAGICDSPPRREMDMLLSVGERITMSLLSMALDAEGCPAISFTGSQCGIITDTSHTDARILEVRGDRVRDALARGYTVVVAGFQGVSEEREITTLGRGGSDTTAVALAAALGAVRCEILKDVDGVMTADPGRVATARRHEDLSWDEMAGVAASGCGVVHIRAVEYAARHEVPLVVRSSFHDGPGTSIGPTAATGPQGPGQADAARAGTTRRDPRGNRYRPLVLNVAEPVTRLHLVTTDTAEAVRWRDLVLEHLDTARTITEWLDSGAGFRWEILAPGPALDALRPLLPAAAMDRGREVGWEDDLTCISLAGGRPDSWLEVQRHVTGLMAEAGSGSWRLRADGSALRILVPGRVSPDLLEHLHTVVLPV